MNCLIIAGEKSGEEHALTFIDDLRSELPHLEMWGVGGDQLKNKNVELLYHLNDFSSWGVSEVIFKIPFYRKAFNHIVSEAKKRNCKTAILIDFQTFNMKLAQKLHNEGIQILYYVAPQAWAWKSYRAKSLAGMVDTLFSIIPFEKEWFGKRGLRKVISVEHPVYTKYKDSFPKEPRLLYTKMNEELNLLLLPGSRNFEVSCLLPRFMRAIKVLKKDREIKVGLLPSPSVNSDHFTPYKKDIDFIFKADEVEKAFDWAHLSFAASGTVTLMTAVFQIPTVVAYDGSLLNEYIFKTFVKYSGFASLANIIHEQEVFPELLIEDASSYNLVKMLRVWLDSSDAYSQTVQKLANTGKIISGEVPQVGKLMAELIREKSNAV